MVMQLTYACTQTINITFCRDAFVLAVVFAPWCLGRRDVWQ